MLVKVFLRFKTKKNFGELNDSAMKRCLTATISNNVESGREGQSEKDQETIRKEIIGGMTCGLLGPTSVIGNAIIL